MNIMIKLEIDIDGGIQYAERKETEISGNDID